MEVSFDDRAFFLLLFSLVLLLFSLPMCVGEGTSKGVFWIAKLADDGGVSSVTWEGAGVVAVFSVFWGVSFLRVKSIHSFVTVCWSTYGAAVLLVYGVCVNSTGFSVGFVFFWGCRLLRGGNLFTVLTVQPPALRCHHPLPFLEESVRDSLKPFSVKAQPEYMVSVRNYNGGSNLFYIFHLSICTQIRCNHVNWEARQNVTNCHRDPTCSYALRLGPKELAGNATLRHFGYLFFCWQQDIPSCKTASAEILSWMPAVRVFQTCLKPDSVERKRRKIRRNWLG